MIKFKFGKIDFTCPLGWEIQVIGSDDDDIKIGGWYITRVPKEMLNKRYKQGTEYTSNSYDLYEYELERDNLSIKINYIDIDEFKEVEEEQE